MRPGKVLQDAKARAETFVHRQISENQLTPCTDCRYEQRVNFVSLSIIYVQTAASFDI